MSEINNFSNCFLNDFYQVIAKTVLERGSLTSTLVYLFLLDNCSLVALALTFHLIFTKRFFATLHGQLIRDTILSKEQTKGQRGR